LETIARYDGHARSPEQAARQKAWYRWHAAIRLNEVRKAHAEAVDDGENPHAWCDERLVHDHLVYSPEAQFVCECLGINMFGQTSPLTEDDTAQRALAATLEQAEPPEVKALSQAWEASAGCIRSAQHERRGGGPDARRDGDRNRQRRY
jgi:hypothetical protein